MTQYLYIARFSKDNSSDIPQGYEIRFTSSKAFYSLSDLNKADSSKFIDDITKAAASQNVPNKLGITPGLLKHHVASGHFSIECPALQAKLAAKQSKRTNNSSRTNNSHGCIVNGLLLIFYFFKWLVWGGWKFKPNYTTGQKVWHIIKSILRIALIVAVIVIINVIVMIISSIIKESR